MVVTPIVGFLVPTRRPAARAPAARSSPAQRADIPPGAGKVVAMGSKPTIVVNTAQGVKAYSAICTHLGCIVAYDSTSSTIVCPCHDGRFNPTHRCRRLRPAAAPLAPGHVVGRGRPDLPGEH